MERARKETKTYIHLVKVEQPEDGIDLFELFYLLVRNWKSLIAGVLLGVLLVAGYTFWLDAPRYEAQVSAYVLSPDGTMVSASEMQLANYLSSDYREVFASRTVMEAAAKKLQLSYSCEQMQRMISILNPSNTRVLYIQVVGTDPVESAELANALFDEGSQYIVDMMHLPPPALMYAAVPAQEPIASEVGKRLLLGALAGLFLPCGVLCIQHALEERKRTTAAQA